MDEQEEFDWHTSAVKYYESARILLFFGYSKQGISLLCLSIEKLLKIYICLKDNQNISYTHDLKRLFTKSGLTKEDFPIIHKTCNNFTYSKIRYDFDAITNDINLVHKELNKEFMRLSNLIIDAYNKKYHCQVNYRVHFNMVHQNRKYKEYCLKRALKSYDKTLRIDFT